MNKMNSIQFGEGNFIRAFVDYCIQLLNEKTEFNGKVSVIQPIEKGKIEILKNQKGQFHLFIEGIFNNKNIRDIKVISCIDKVINPYKEFESFLELAKDKNLNFVFSNTTEVGIEYNKNDLKSMKPPISFPGKLTIFLYNRFKFFKGDENKILHIIPCELIESNGEKLKKIILKIALDWNLGRKFYYWINKNKFHNSLVDRIVPGYPKKNLSFYKKQLQFNDELMVACEPFFLWVIEGGKDLKKKFPVEQIKKIDVRIVKDIGIYKTRKIQILNGSHTIMVSLGIISNIDNVSDFLKNSFLKKILIDTVVNEIILSINHDSMELKKYFNKTLERFENPFIDHKLKAISLNSLSKFKSRIIPSIVSFSKIYNRAPYNLYFILSSFIILYHRRKHFKILDNYSDQFLFDDIKHGDDYVNKILSNKNLWGVDLSKLPKLKECTSVGIKLISDEYDIKKAYSSYIEKIKTL